MKRLISLLLAAACCVSLLGCQRKENTPVIAQERTTATPIPTPTPDPLEAELNEAMALFDAIDMSVYRIDGDGNLRLTETEWYEYPTSEVGASNESYDAFVDHMISKGYEFLRKFQPRFLEKRASSEAAKLLYYQASYNIQTGNYYRQNNPLLLFDEFYGVSNALTSGNCDELLDKLTPCDKKTDEAVFAFLYDQWCDLSEDGISYMIENGLTGVIANSLKVMQDPVGVPPGPNLGNDAPKIITALVAFEKAGTPECEEVLSAFESDMKAGVFEGNKEFMNYVRSFQIDNLDNAPAIKAKLAIADGGAIRNVIEASPRILAAFMSYPLSADGQMIGATSDDLPKDFVASNPQKGRYFLLVDPAPDRSDSFNPSRFDNLELVCKTGETLRSVNNPNDAQILVYVKFSYKFYRTYYASTGNSTLKIYRGKISLTAKDAVTGKKLASQDISAEVQSTYTTSPGSLYASSFPDSAIEKFAKKLVAAADKL